MKLHVVEDRVKQRFLPKSYCAPVADSIGAAALTSNALDRIIHGMKSKILPVAVLFACSTNLPGAMTFPLSLNSSDRVIGEAQNNGDRGYFTGAGGQTGGSGASGSRVQANSLFGFLLPDRPAGENVVSATLSFRINTAREEVQPLPSLDTYLLDSADPSSDGFANVYLDAAADTNTSNIFIGRTVEADLANDVPNSDTTYNKDVSYTFSAAAITKLDSLYTGTSPGGREVFFRFNMGANVSSTDLNRYNINTGANAPVFTLNTDVIPEPSTALLGALGALALMRRRR